MHRAFLHTDMSRGQSTIWDACRDLMLAERGRYLQARPFVDALLLLRLQSHDPRVQQVRLGRWELARRRCLRGFKSFRLHMLLQCIYLSLCLCLYRLYLYLSLSVSLSLSLSPSHSL